MSDSNGFLIEFSQLEKLLKDYYDNLSCGDLLNCSHPQGKCPIGKEVKQLDNKDLQAEKKRFLKERKLYIGNEDLLYEETISDLKEKLTSFPYRFKVLGQRVIKGNRTYQNIPVSNEFLIDEIHKLPSCLVPQIKSFKLNRKKETISPYFFDAIRDYYRVYQFFIWVKTIYNKPEKPIEIGIKPEIIDDLFEAFSAYFSAEDHADLIKLLKGEQVLRKIFFKGHSNQLTYAFRQLKEGGKIVNTKTFLINWICNSFTYKNKKSMAVQGFNLDNVKRDMTLGNKKPSFPISLSEILKN